MSLTTVCIIGGSGFIGTTVSRLLTERGDEFTIIDHRDSATFPQHRVHGDITDPATLKGKLRGDCIIHLAAAHRDDIRPISRYDEINVQGTKNVCAEAEAAGIERIVFASSVAVYGFAPADTDETGKIAPFNDYGRTKALAEDVLHEWQARDPARRSLTIIRPTVVFGPGNRGNVYNLLRQIASGRFLMIGSGENRKSMAYVGNVAAFFIHFINAAPGVRTYNYIDGPDFSMNQLVRLVCRELTGKDAIGTRLPIPLGMAFGLLADGVSRLTGKRLPISRMRVRKFISTTAFTSARREEHGFVPTTSLEDAMRITLDAEFINPNPNSPEFETE